MSQWPYHRSEPRSATTVGCYPSPNFELLLCQLAYLWMIFLKSSQQQALSRPCPRLATCMLHLLYYVLQTVLSCTGNTVVLFSFTPGCMPVSLPKLARARLVTSTACG
jgi:hypothetical protein